MNKALLAALNDSERLLVAETEPPMLALLDEDEASALHTRVLRARNKAQGIYRRGAAGKVSATGGRGKARPQNSLARTKVEAFEEALARVSQRLAVLARQSARELRDGAARRSGSGEDRGGGAGREGTGPRQGPHRRPEAHRRPEPALPGEREDARGQPGRERALAGQARRTLRTGISVVGLRFDAPESPERPSLVAVSPGSHRVAA